MADGTITLLPCPMCGNRGIFVEREDLCAYQARCDDCGARGPVVEHGDYIEDDGRGVAAARAAWNRRHPQDVTIPSAALEHDREAVAQRNQVAELKARVAAGHAAPVAWMCEDLILTIADPGITRDRAHAEQRAAMMFRGKPAWRVTPLYAAPPTVGQAVPDGWKLVPITPTQDMLMAGADRPQPDPADPRDHEWGGMYRAIYGAMLGASPSPDRVVTALAQIDRALGRDNVAANPLRRVDYPKGRFGPAMLDGDGDDELNTREMKLIANSHGFELRVAIEEWDIEAAEILERNGTFGEALEVEDPPQSIVGGYQLVGAWEGEEGGLVTVYARPLKGVATPGASS